MKLFLIFILLFSLCGCNKNARKTDDIFAMDTIISLDVYCENPDNVLTLMNDEITRLDKKFAPDSEMIYDDETKKLIETSDSISHATDGAFDIYLGEVLKIWGFRNKNYRIPDDDEINLALNAKALDFGGIAKGYAGDRLKEICEENNVKSALFSLGGNIVAIGKTPDGKPWTIGIANPKNPNEAIGYVKVTDKSVVTSGGYQRYFTENNEIYHHIINPKTGKPAKSGLSSVTVISPDSITADALSTAFYVLGRDKTLEIYTSGKFNFEAVLIEDDGNIVTTDNANFSRKD